MSVPYDDNNHLDSFNKFFDGNLSFEDLGNDYAEVLESIASIFTDDGDVEKFIREARDFSDEHGLSFSDSMLALGAQNNPDIEAKLAEVILTNIVDVEIIPKPDVLIDNVMVGADSDYKSTYESMERIANAMPDSVPAYLFELIKTIEGIDRGINTLEHVHAEALKDATSDDKIQYENDFYEQSMKMRLDARNECMDKIDSVRSWVGMKATQDVTTIEKELVYDLVSSEHHEQGCRDVGDVISDISDYCRSHPTSPLAAIISTRSEYQSALVDITENSTKEEKQDLLDKYHDYEVTCSSVLNSREIDESGRVVVSEYDKDNATNDNASAERATNDSEDKTENDTDNNNRTTTDDSGTKVDVPEDKETKDTADAASKDSTDKSIPVDKDESKVNIRVDSRAVLDYGIATRIYDQREKYESFNQGEDVRQLVYAKQDDIEKIAKEGGPLCKEFLSIINELDQLGDKNGDVEHDARIDELSARQEDLVLYAGAVIGSTKNEFERGEEQSVYNYHQAEMRVDDGDTDGLDDLSTYAEELKSFSSDGADRSLPGSRYNDLLLTRNEEKIKAETLLEKYKSATDPTEKDNYSNEQFEARFHQDKAQLEMDKMYFEIDICHDGIEKYGEIDSRPADVEVQENIAGVDIKLEPVDMEPPQSAYEAAKEEYDSIKDKYNFRNTFVAYDRLKFDIEAYKSGEDGSRGHPVSGGDIAMAVIEFTRTNILESMMEVAIRKIFDDAFPAVDKDAQDVEQEKTPQVRVDNTDADIHDQVDSHGVATDRGIVIDDVQDVEKEYNKENPGFGKYAGADMTKDSIVNDVSMKVYNCGPKRSDFTITTKDESGKIESINIPPMRLVTMGDNRYLVDPFGQSVWSNVTTDSPSKIENYDISFPKFDKLDISSNKRVEARLEAWAKEKGCTVEDCKREIIDKCKENYVNRGLDNIDKHETYIKDTLLPRETADLKACQDRIAYVDKAREVFLERVENPKATDSKADTEKYKEFASFLGDVKYKLDKLEAGLKERIDNLKGTLELYSDVRDVVRHSVSLDGKFVAVVRGETDAFGKVDNVGYDITVNDIRTIDKAMEVTGFDADDRLLERFSGRGWSEEANVTYDWNGAQHDSKVESKSEQETRATVENAAKDSGVERKYSDLDDHPDRNTYHIEPFDAKAVLEESGVEMPTREQNVEREQPAEKENVSGMVDHKIPAIQSESADKGVIHDKIDDENKKLNKSNPAFGRYAGADLSKEKTISNLKVYSCGRMESYAVEKVNSNGEMQEVRIPAIRLVEMPSGSKYLVDPFGKVLWSDTAVKDESGKDTADNIRFPRLDILNNPNTRELFEVLSASNINDRADVYKEVISEEVMGRYVDRCMGNIDKHETYIKDKLLPRDTADLQACQDRIDYIDKVKEAFAERAENPKDTDTNADVEKYKSFVSYLDEVQSKLETLRDGLSDRIEGLKNTLELYADTKDTVQNSDDTKEKFLSVVRSETESTGKIDNQSYGVSEDDVRTIDKALEAVGYNDNGDKLEAHFSGRGWSENPDISYDWKGAQQESKVDAEGQSNEAKADKESDAGKIDVKGVLVEAGVIKETKEEALERLGMGGMVDGKRPDKPDIETVKGEPTKDQIEKTREYIKEYGSRAATTDGFGARVVTSNLDWSKVKPNEILRDAGTDRFLVRPEGADRHIPMTAEQAAAYLHGPLEKADIAEALDKYFEIAKDSSSTYSFAEDFLEVNKFRVDPADVLDVYKEKLEEFFDSSNKDIDTDDKERLETLADCLASAKDTIVETFTDKVADKIEAIVSDAIDKGDGERVGMFIDKLSASLENVSDKVANMNIDISQIKLNDDVAAKLEAIRNDSGIQDGDMDKLVRLAKTLDAAIEGYSDALKTILIENYKNEIDTGVDNAEKDTDAVVAADDNETDAVVAQDDDSADKDATRVDSDGEVHEKDVDVDESDGANVEDEDNLEDDLMSVMDDIIDNLHGIDEYDPSDYDSNMDLDSDSETNADDEQQNVDMENDDTQDNTSDTNDTSTDEDSAESESTNDSGESEDTDLPEGTYDTENSTDETLEDIVRDIDAIVDELENPNVDVNADENDTSADSVDDTAQPDFESTPDTSNDNEGSSENAPDVQYDDSHQDTSNDSVDSQDNQNDFPDNNVDVQQPDNIDDNSPEIDPSIDLSDSNDYDYDNNDIDDDVIDIG